MSGCRKMLAGLLLAVAVVVVARAQDPEDYELPPINYSHAQAKDAVTQLMADAATNGWLRCASDREVVELLLRKLHVPIESQMLVFSKTSFQKDRISPDHPRALYYNDNCYVGWVPGGLVEIATIDTNLGPVFYSFDPHAVTQKQSPVFSRRIECLNCHGANFVPGIPALLARSVYPADDGEPLYRQGTELVDFRTPFSHRWGGWYVTGKHGAALHRGNVFASENGDQLVFNPAPGANVTNLSSFFDTGNYLTNSSDIVSLLVFEQQTAMENVVTRAGMKCRRMLDYQKRVEQEIKGASARASATNIVQQIFDASVEEILDAFLFKDEADLPDGIVGAPGFQKAFETGARRDSEGDSLKDLLLSDHLFKNRCSYLVYSDAFLSLPTPLKQRVYDGLAKALRPEGPEKRYDYLHDSERRRILAILKETQPEFREWVDHQG